MAQTTIKVNCSESDTPVRVGDVLVFATSRNGRITVPVEHARHFYTLTITHDSTTKTAITCCGLQVKSGDHAEYFFVFPMSRMDKAMEWFRHIHALLSPVTNAMEKFASCVQ